MAVCVRHSTPPWFSQLLAGLGVSALDVRSNQADAEWHAGPAYLSCQRAPAGRPPLPAPVSLGDGGVGCTIFIRWMTGVCSIHSTGDCYRIELCRSGFVTLLPVPLQEQPVVVLLLEGALVSWSLAMDECSGHEDLSGSGHRSVIPYIHGRTELYYSSIYEPEPFFPNLCEEVSTRSFYSSRSGSYNETRGPIGSPEVVETLYNI
jgi:hypothetical protein